MIEASRPTGIEEEHEALLRFLYICPAGLIQITADGTIVTINPYAMSVLMPLAGPAGVTNLFDVLDPHNTELHTHVRDFQGGSGMVLRGYRVHLAPVAPGQAVCVLSCTVMMISRDCVMILLQDISHEMVLETNIEVARIRAMANDRLVALGTMAAGLAHEINNPLAVIHAMVDDLADKAARGEASLHEVAVAATDVMRLCDRIEQIISGLLRLARNSIDDPFKPALAADIVRHATGLCEAFFRDGGVTLVVAPIDPSLSLVCREGQIGQVLVNLLQNAFFAAKEANAAPLVRVEVARSGDAVELRVTDNGAGVPPAIRERIMEPFFTTKPIGEGTGLGLSIAAEIVRAHGGQLILDTAHAGTSFVISLAHSPEPAIP